MSNAQIQHQLIPRGYINGADVSSVHEPVPGLRERFREWLHEQFSYSKQEDETLVAKASPPYALIAILVTILVWASGVTVAGVWTVATMSANLQELKNENVAEKVRHKEEEAAMEQRFQAALTAQSNRSESALESLRSDMKLKNVYVTDMRESLIARGIIKKGNN